MKWHYNSSSSSGVVGDGGVVRRGSTGGGKDCDGDDLQVWRVLHEGDDVPLVAFAPQKEIFKNDLALRQRELAEPCGFCAREGADLERVVGGRRECWR